MNVVCGGPVSRIRAISDRYREESAKTRSDDTREPLIGVNRYILVADTDAEAQEIGRKAWPAFHHNFIKLWRKHGTRPARDLPADFDRLMESGNAIAGSVKTVTQQFTAQLEDGGLNYLIGSFMFGDMPHSDAVASVRLFAKDVMPALRVLGQVPASVRSH